MDEAAVWRVYVMEYARSKDQPWVDLISGMYREGTMDLPFSFILAQRDDRNVLVDTGFMQEEHGSGFSRKFGIPTWISPVRMLAEMDLSPEAILVGSLSAQPRRPRPRSSMSALRRFATSPRTSQTR